ncbi:MAG TPA: hypothetical protein VH164_04205 [Ktedonobacteraceae bacterium]|nr:hypothetical protein [Ktedonobacteraceae bacterium]
MDILQASSLFIDDPVANLPISPMPFKSHTDFHGFPEGTILGHMHLNASNLDESIAFYEQTFGLELMINLYRQAGFVRLLSRSFISTTGKIHQNAARCFVGVVRA